MHPGNRLFVSTAIFFAERVYLFTTQKRELTVIAKFTWLLEEKE